MKRAISNADAFKFTAKPNPVVGALLIKDNQIISQGEHEVFGSCHAEINAIAKAKKELGKTFNSSIHMTVCNGHIVFEDGQVKEDIPLGMQIEFDR